MVEAVGKDTDQQPFAGELGRLRQVELKYISESGTAANILVTGVDHAVLFLQNLHELLMLLKIPESGSGFMVNPGRGEKMVVAANDDFFALIKMFSYDSGIF